MGTRLQRRTPPSMHVRSYHTRAANRSQRHAVNRALGKELSNSSGCALAPCLHWQLETGGRHGRNEGLSVNDRGSSRTQGWVKLADTRRLHPSPVGDDRVGRAAGDCVRLADGQCAGSFACPADGCSGRLKRASGGKKLRVFTPAAAGGTAQDVAEGLGRQAVRRHYAVRVVSADAYDPIQLPTELHVVFVTATAGQVTRARADSRTNHESLSRRLLAPLAAGLPACAQGDPPDNFKRLWRFLLRKSLPATSLQAVHVAVFGLGDSGYQKYNVRRKRSQNVLAPL